MKARDIAFGAVFSAISVILLSSSAIFSDDVFLLMLSSLPILILADRFGRRVGFLSYAVVAVIVFFIFPLRTSTMGFIMLFGPYVLLKGFFEKSKYLKVIFHFILLFGLSLISYLVMSYLLKINLGKYSVLVIILEIFVLVLYERFVEYFTRWYKNFSLRRWM